jgi:hypothetical protein
VRWMRVSRIRAKPRPCTSLVTRSSSSGGTAGVRLLHRELGDEEQTFIAKRRTKALVDGMMCWIGIDSRL